VLSPRGISSWLGATGAYYRVLDVARARGRKDFEMFLRFNGWLQERYVRHLIHVAHPCLPPSRLVVRRVIPEVPYDVGKREMLTNDVTVDLGLDLVLFEVTAKRLTAKSLVEADAETIARDLRQLILDKMEQLGRVIRDVFDGHVLLPGVDLEHVRRVWPVIVCADGVFESPSLWDYIEREGGHHLDLSAAVRRAVKPLTMLDLEELETLMGIVDEGHSLVAVLERMSSPTWAGRGLKAWHYGDTAGRIGSGESEFVRSELHRAFAAILAALAIQPIAQDASAKEAA
jgi:hypothetical protein